MKSTSFLIPGIVLITTLFLSACSPETTSEATVGEPSETSFLLSEAPESAPGLNEAIASAPAGESFVFHARVGGVQSPVSSDFALFIVADESLEFCDETEGEDNCATPWDACCEDSGKIAASRALVQFTDGSGNPVEVDLGDALGLEANDQVIVRGRLAPDDGSGNRAILAEGVAFVGKG